MKQGDYQAPLGWPWQYVDGAPCNTNARLIRGDCTPYPSCFARVLMSFSTRLIILSARARFRILVSGTFPSSGCVLVSYHNSYWDGIVVAALNPRVVPITGRRWSSNPVVGWYLNVYGVFWTQSDSVSRATRYVGRGGMIWAAPYKFDRGRATAAHHGPARMSISGRVPIIPMTLTGLSRESRKRWRRNVVHITIGAPLWPDEGESAEDFTTRYEEVLSVAKSCGEQRSF